MGTIIEFAIVLLLQRKQHLNRLIYPEKYEKSRKKKIPAHEFDIFSAKIDATSFILFAISYVMFNAVYWLHYLMFTKRH